MTACLALCQQCMLAHYHIVSHMKRYEFETKVIFIVTNINSVACFKFYCCPAFVETNNPVLFFFFATIVCACSWLFFFLFFSHLQNCHSVGWPCLLLTLYYEFTIMNSSDLIGFFFWVFSNSLIYLQQMLDRWNFCLSQIKLNFNLISLKFL